MPRAEYGTPKYLANKMKSKGLQKLRWYCQMCEKQCRDDNGFKCHLMSESHQRQILLFVDNSKQYINNFSYELNKGYLDLLHRQFGSKRVSANRVYQEYIKDRNHVHMNSTRWVTLGGYVRWLGATGKCKIDENEKGWFIQYIERDPDTIAAMQRKHKRAKLDKDDEERLQEFIDNQVKHGQDSGTSSNTPEFTELTRNEDDKLTLAIKLTGVTKAGVSATPIHKLAVVKKDVDDDTRSTKSYKRVGTKPVKSALDEIMAKEEQIKERANRKDYWLAEGIVVKVVTKSLGEKYHKEKGVVVEVRDKYAAVVRMIETGHKLKLDQVHVETVIPAIGGPLRVVNGAYRGHNATLLAIDEENFCTEIEIAAGVLQGRKVKGVVYEDICKRHVENEAEEVS